MQLPSFVITVASPVFPDMKFVYKKETFEQKTEAHIDIPSVHLIGTKDQYFDKMTANNLFFNSKVVLYHEGHKFPREIPEEGVNTLTEFITEQYMKVNGKDCE